MPQRRALYNAHMLMFSLCIAKIVCDKSASRFCDTLADLERSSAHSAGASHTRAWLRAGHALAFLSPQHAASVAPRQPYQAGPGRRLLPMSKRILSFAYRLRPPSAAGSSASGADSAGMMRQRGPGHQRQEAASGPHGRARRRSQLAMDLLDSLPPQLQGNVSHRHGSLLLASNWVSPAGAPDQVEALTLQLENWYACEAPWLSCAQFDPVCAVRRGWLAVDLSVV